MHNWHRTTSAASKAASKLSLGGGCSGSTLFFRSGHRVSPSLLFSFSNRRIYSDSSLPLHRVRIHRSTYGSHQSFGSLAAASLFLFCASASEHNGIRGQNSVPCQSSSTFLRMTSCHQAEEEPQTQETLDLPPFEDSVLSYDHYNGVTLNLGKYLNCQGWQNEHETTNGDVAVETSSADNPPSNSFARQLDKALQFWRAEGRKGIWIHAPPIASSLIPDCVSAGFDFHKVLRENVTDEEESKPPTLVLSRWLPDTPSKLPLGPSHQVGVGVVVLNPADPSQMLCVQEQSGPAASYKLWKMPTGLLDPCEDIPEAAARELEEETGLKGTLQGIICFRQAHRPGSNSDLFFVCHMDLNDDNNIQFRPQEDEIAAIQWMPVQEFCDQQTWQGSPLYTTLNNCILKVSKAAIAAREQQNMDMHQAERRHMLPMIEHAQLEVGFARDGQTNALFLPPSTNPMKDSSKL